MIVMSFTFLLRPNLTISHPHVKLHLIKISTRTLKSSSCRLPHSTPMPFPNSPWIQISLPNLTISDLHIPYNPRSSCYLQLRSPRSLSIMSWSCPTTNIHRVHLIALHLFWPFLVVKGPAHTISPQRLYCLQYPSLLGHQSAALTRQLTACVATSRTIRRYPTHQFLSLQFSMDHPRIPHSTDPLYLPDQQIEFLHQTTLPS